MEGSCGCNRANGHSTRRNAKEEQSKEEEKLKDSEK